MKSKHLVVSPYLQRCRRAQTPHIRSGNEKIKPQPWLNNTLFVSQVVFQFFLQASVINAPPPHNAPVDGKKAVNKLPAHFLLVCLCVQLRDQ